MMTSKYEEKETGRIFVYFAAAMHTTNKQLKIK